MLSLAEAAINAAKNECTIGKCSFDKWFCNNAATDGSCCTLFYGILVGFVICLILWLIASIHSRNKNLCKDITIEDSEKGNFVISAGAMKRFAERIVSENAELKFIGLKLLETRLGLVMKITLSAKPDAELLTLRKTLRERIFKEMEEKLGITDHIAQINFEVLDFEEATKQDEDASSDIPQKI